ncbi:MAG: GTPase Era [Bacteroidetes Order II. Incertae sedis bacterium]|jgi:GTPase|nr:GTPase Era [Bacteroidetes Order II. bacterium]HAY37712.1 GTPase Era [Bacteroidota bacterium]MBT4052733.1 GTPase Era [Bacteroidetes Order II. bacterium]MBT5250662.1 GTPase Era [Bacteroidetes Order II. bacterium]MBT6202010.1 GTPase Era [Bacteroidetes Order II. bacterium]
MTDAHHKSGYVALIGKPNVGKSTLLNTMMGMKLSIVTNKPQTTRRRVLGILSDDHYQMILLDTPGIIKPRYGLQEAMMKDVRTSTSDGDILVFMADATRDSVDDLSLEFVGDTPAILVLNKIDKVKQEDMLPLVAAYTEAHNFEEVIPISALKGRNIEVLLKAISDRLPLGPAFYPKDMVSEQPENFFISEIIREKIFKQFKQEVPYATQVNIVSWELKDDAKDVINAEIIVERDSQKGILIGKGGKAMKKVGTYAREDIEDFLNRGVYLKIHVKVRDNWRNSDTQLRSFGFDK